MNTLQRILAPSLNLRRTLFALLVTLVTAGCLGGLMGFAVADGAPVPESPPDFVGVAPIHGGDHALYNVTEVRRMDGSETVTIAPRPYVEFKMEAPGWYYERDGTPVPTRAVEYVEHQDHDGEWVPHNSRIHFSPDGTRVYAHELLGRDSVNWDPESMPEGTFEHGARTVHFPESELDAIFFCAPFNALQGASLNATAMTDLFRHCHVRQFWDDEFRGRLSAYEERDGRQRFTFNWTNGSSHVGITFDAAIPYPVRLVIEHQRAFFEDPPSGLHDVIELVGFDRGAADPPRGPGPAALAPIRWEPRPLWGIDDSGLTHPFRLSDAFARARDDPDRANLREFLAAHPEAYTARAGFTEDHNDGTDRYLWSFTVTDGDENLTTCIERNVRPRVRGTGVTLPVPGPTEERYAYGGCEAAALWPPPAAVPALSPRLADVAAWWAALAGPEYAGRTLNSYGVETSCRSANCESHETNYQAGYANQSTTWMRPLVPSQPATTVQTFHQSVLSVTDKGDLRSLFEQYQKYDNRPGEGPGAAAPALQPVTPMSAGGAPSWIWRAPPTAAVIGSGVFALVVGLAYWLWPAAKGAVGLGLFSRVERAHALDQPSRNQVFALIEQQPGLHLTAIADRLGLPRSLVVHHLRKLESVGLVSRERGRQFVCYFPRGTVDRRVMLVLPVLRAPGARDVLRAVLEAPGLHLAGVARRLRLSAPTVLYHAQRLLEVGAIRQEKASLRVKYFPCEPARDALTLALESTAPVAST